MNDRDDNVVAEYFFLEVLKGEEICEREEFKNKLQEKHVSMLKETGYFIPIDFMNSPNGDRIMSNVFNELVFMNRGTKHFDVVDYRNGVFMINRRNLGYAGKIKKDGEYFIFTERSQEYLDRFKAEVEEIMCRKKPLNRV